MTTTTTKYDLEAIRERVRERVKDDPVQGMNPEFGCCPACGSQYCPECDTPPYGIRRYRSLSREPETIPEIVAWEVYDALYTNHDYIQFIIDERTDEE